MKVLDVDGYFNSFGIVPGTFADAIPRVYRSFSINGADAQIGSPITAGCSTGRGHLLAKRIRSFQSAEVGAVARTSAGDKKNHRCVSVLSRDPCDTEHGYSHCDDRKVKSFHRLSSSLIVRSADNL